MAAQRTSRLVARDLPLRLREIPDAPKHLFAVGDAATLDRPSVAVVGSRRCTRQGRATAFALGRDLAAQGLNVVSGLAYGVDAAAHQGALAGSLAPTVAVLGSGLGNIYPRAHERLAKNIVDAGGVIVSEYDWDAGPRKHHFPARNRVVSGLCLGVVIVEASDRSGSLITARLALEQGREVMAVPSAISSPLSAGCHRLIREGAALVENAEHVLEVLGCHVSMAVQPASEPEDDDVLEYVGASVTSLDALVAATGLGVEEVLERVTELEIDGRVLAQGGGYVRT